MKLNFDNFLQSSHSDIKRIHKIQEGDDIVRSEYPSHSVYYGCQYHEVKWWAVIYRNNQQELLVFLKNPKSKWDCYDWCKNHKFFTDTLKILKGE